MLLALPYALDPSLPHCQRQIVSLLGDLPEPASIQAQAISSSKAWLLSNVHPAARLHRGQLPASLTTIGACG